MHIIYALYFTDNPFDNSFRLPPTELSGVRLAEIEIDGDSFKLP